MRPEERRYYMAMLRTLPWSALALFVVLAVCVTANAPPWLAAILMAVVVVAVPLWFTRRETRDFLTAARKRRDRRDAP